MKILAFDNSTSTCTVALQNGARVKSVSKTAPMLQARLILPLIDELLSDFNMKLSDLDAIAYGRGPGSFTGIRIASSVAQGLGFAANIRLLPISSLAALAQTAFLTYAVQDIYVAVDARMGEIYWAHYTHTGHPQQNIVHLNEVEELTRPNFIKFPVNSSDKNVCYVGSGWEIAGVQFQHKPSQVHATLVPTGEALLQLAQNQYLEPDILKVSAAIPVYLR